VRAFRPAAPRMSRAEALHYTSSPEVNVQRKCHDALMAYLLHNGV
jgi:hypothetical protein